MSKKRLYLFNVKNESKGNILAIISKDREEAFQMFTNAFKESSPEECLVHEQDTKETTGVMVQTTGLMINQTAGIVALKENPLSKESVAKAVEEMKELNEDDDDCDCIICQVRRDSQEAPPSALELMRFLKSLREANQ